MNSFYFVDRLVFCHCPSQTIDKVSCRLIEDLCVLAFFLVELTLLLGGGVLVLLVLGDEIVHVGLGLSELHLVHTLTYLITYFSILFLE